MALWQDGTLGKHLDIYLDGECAYFLQIMMFALPVTYIKK